MNLQVALPSVTTQTLRQASLRSKTAVLNPRSRANVGIEIEAKKKCVGKKGWTNNKRSLHTPAGCQSYQFIVYARQERGADHVIVTFTLRRLRSFRAWLPQLEVLVQGTSDQLTIMWRCYWRHTVTMARKCTYSVALTERYHTCTCIEKLELKFKIKLHRSINWSDI